MTIIKIAEGDERVRACHGRFVVGLAAGVLVCSPAYGAQWLFQPSVDVGAIHDDNIRLVTSPQDSTSGYLAAARLVTERRTETSRADIDAVVVHSAYDSEDVNDKTEQRLRLDAEKQTSERGTLGLDGEYRRDTLFESVVVEDGIGDEQDVDIGLTTLSEVRRRRLYLRPSWRWSLTERSTIELAYRRTDVSFSGGSAGNLRDYDDDRFSATYSRQLSPRDDFLLTANYFQFQPDLLDREAKTTQLLVGMARKFSETLRGSTSVGASRTTEQVPGQEDTSSGSVVNLRLSQRTEISRLDGLISRDINPSGIGRAVRTDQVRLAWTRGVAPTLDFVLRARLLRNRAIEGADTGGDRRYYEIAPELRWQWLENLSVVGTYRYRKQEFDASEDSADSRAVFLGLSYGL